MQKVLLGRFVTAAELPITSEAICSDFCFCRPSVRHLAGREVPDMLAQCDECGHWCHVQCLLESGLIPSDYDASTPVQCRACHQKAARDASGPRGATRAA